MQKRVILLFSGGLDSLLSYYLLKKADFWVKPVQFYIPFLHIQNQDKYIKRIKENYGIDLSLIDISEKYLKILFNPEFGYGDNLNPCVDCKILFLKEAKKIMENENFDCIATGEIPGQRPFSQQKSFMNLIEKKSGVRGFILRPLSISSSKLNFEIDKTKFLDLKGRTRKPQLQLAKEFNISPIPSPAGGCLLTDEGYCNKIKMLRKVFKDKEIIPDYFEIIKFGRVKVLNHNLLIIGRNRKENEILEKFSKKLNLKLIKQEIPAPNILIFGDLSINEVKDNIVEILKKYTKPIYHEKIKIF